MLLPLPKRAATPMAKPPAKDPLEGMHIIELGLLKLVFETPPLGVFALPKLELRAKLTRVRKAFDLVLWFVQIAWGRGPALLMLYAAAEAMDSMRCTVDVYLMSMLVEQLEKAARNAEVDTRKMGYVMVALLAFRVVNAFLTWAERRIHTKLRTRMRLYFEFKMLEGTFSRDLTQACATRTKTPDAHETLEILITFASNTITACLGAFVIFRLVRASQFGTMLVATWCVRKLPLFDSLKHQIWRTPFFYFMANQDRHRTLVMNSIASPFYREEVLTLNLSSWILGEYTKARGRLGDVSLDETPYTGLLEESNPLQDILINLLEDWPTLYYACTVLRGDHGLPFSNILALRNISNTLQWNIRRLRNLRHILEEIAEIKKGIIQSDNPDGCASYPRPEQSDSAGMAVEFQDVSFTYPSAKSTSPALGSVSFIISPGQVVVIVGANGSGKSSIVKLLSSLYATTSGTILIDGQPISEYAAHDLRLATAVLSQSHEIFSSLSLVENVGLGDVTRMNDRRAIEDAMQLAGAREMAEKLKDGLDTVLQPIWTKWPHKLDESVKKLEEIYKDWEPRASFSGGENQRLAAARTFMRLSNPKVKLVIVDEPSSAMDPEAEFTLFQRLRDARVGRTMILITHRFGHLTKHADLILCMKKGNIEESGTHTELMQKQGEYANLYNIQAKAFEAEVQVDKVN